MSKSVSNKKVKPLRNIKIKYPDESIKNKALYKVISRIPTTSNSKLPVAYIKSLPMIIGVVTILFLIFIPAVRQNTIQISQNSFNHLKNKTLELGDYVSLSMKAGVSSYFSQLEKHINILPIDTNTEPKLYLGRIESNNFSKLDLDINLGKMAENTHMMTAKVSGIFDNF